MMKSPAARRRKEEGERGGKGEGELGAGTFVMLVAQHHPDRRPPPHHSIVRLGALSADASCQLDVLKKKTSNTQRGGANNQFRQSRQVQTEVKGAQQRASRHLRGRNVVPVSVRVSDKPWA